MYNFNHKKKIIKKIYIKTQNFGRYSEQIIEINCIKQGM